MLHALICVYNASETITECIEALSKFVDHIIIFDGLWLGFEGKSINSNDGTLEKIIKWVSLHPTFNMTYMQATKLLHQYEIRTILLNEVPEGDWFLIVDSDEIYEAPDDLSKTLYFSSDRGYRVFHYDVLHPRGYAKALDQPRIFRKTKGMKYSSNHRFLEDDNGTIFYGDIPVLLNVIFCHNGNNKAMRPFMEQYKRWLFKFETKNANK